MFKISLALMLIALQGLSALPGRLHLCFEADGTICCVEGGEHHCDCDHTCGHNEAACHECEHSTAHEPQSCEHDTEASTECDDARSHQHVVIGDFDHQSVITKTIAVDVDEFSNSLALPPSVCPSERLLSAFQSLTLIRDEPSAASFSLFARASTVIRC